jgi:hypothetical protein
MTEYAAIVAASGRIGYLKHPLAALRRLRDKLCDLIRKPAVKPLLKLASTAADAAGAAGLGGATGEALGLAAEVRDGPFHPPFISLGATKLALYRAALRASLPSAKPPPGSIMLFEQLRGGRSSHSWLNDGEEGKLASEATSGFERRRADYLSARKALDRFLRS